MNKSINLPISSYGVLNQDQFDCDLDELAEQVRRIGYGVLDPGYTPAQLGEISTEFDRARAAYLEKWGEERLKAINEFYTVRALLTHGGPMFRRLAMHPKLMTVIGKLIAGKYVLNQQNGIVNPPGESYNQASWHRDLPYQHFVSSSPLAINALFCLDDFIAENGATFVLPASHKTASFPSQKYIDKNAEQLTAKAGQFIIMDCMLFHSGGTNLTSHPRRAINHAFAIPYFKQQIDIPLNSNPKELTSEEREILGFNYQTSASIEAYLASRR